MIVIDTAQEVEAGIRQTAAMMITLLLRRKLTTAHLQALVRRDEATARRQTEAKSQKVMETIVCLRRRQLIQMMTSGEFFAQSFFSFSICKFSHNFILWLFVCASV